ncbi:MAG: exported protein of unknown function [Gemmatimonadetes bacterium]|nr:exported protein of unknown function [Gemmatimonadota bacterium]
MKARHLYALAAVLVTTGFALPRRADPPRKWAVVVGVGDYVNYGDEEGGDLPGAANDARSVRDVLQARWGFRPENVHVLLDTAATRAAIRREMTAWLPSVVKPGDLVVFFYSGHGSQVFDQNGDEDDGLDETLCPTDVMRNSARMDVTDDELGAWVRALPTTNVSVILDSCHSGTATRGVLPGVHRKALNRAPAALREGPPPAASGLPAPAAHAGAPKPNPDDLGGDVLEIAAAQSDQYAMDASFEGQGGVRHGGAFTVPLVRYLWQVPAGTSYQEVFRLTRDAVRRGSFAQNPQISGAARERPAFGVAGAGNVEGTLPVITVSRAPAAHAGASVLSASGGSVVLDGGAAAGMTPGSVYRVGGAELTVASVEGSRARARLTGGTAPAAGAGASLAAYDYPTAVLHVSAGDVPAAILAGLQAHPIPDVAVLRDPGAPAELALRRDAEGWVLVGSDGTPRHRLAGRTPAEVGEQLAAALRQEQAALALASLENPAHPFAVDFGFTGDRNVFRLGEKLGFRFRSAREGYLTIVDLDPAGKVTVLYPNAYQRDGHVAAGQEVELPAPEMGFSFTAEAPEGHGVVRAFVTERPLALGFEEGDAAQAAAVAEALRTAAGAPSRARGGAVPLLGWSTGSVVYEFTR